MNLRAYLRDERIQFFLLGITFVLYVWLKHWFLGALLAAEIFAFVALEIREGARQHGWKEEIKETVKTLVVVIVIFFILSKLLGTSIPISAVVSCSMNPVFHRGDFVVIKGVRGAEIKAPEITLSHEQVEEVLSPKTEVLGPAKLTVNGSLYAFCAFNKNEPVCKEFFLHPELFQEKRGPLIFHYGTCIRAKGDIGRAEPCVLTIEFKNKEFRTYTNNDIIVYKPKKGTLFARVGDIIHRAVLKIKDNETGKSYVLTKGDNVNILDIQMYDYELKEGNVPPDDKSIKGKLWFVVPYLGYLKLAVSGFLKEGELCYSTLTPAH